MKKTDKKRILKILHATKSHTYFATVDGNKPVIRSVSPIVENDLSIWIATFGNSRKVWQIKKNPNVCLEFVSQPDGSKCAIVHGRAQIVKNLAQKKRVWKIAPYDMSGYFPAGPSSKDYCLLKIRIKAIEWHDRWVKAKIYKT
jgi:general stress protein 26